MRRPAGGVSQTRADLSVDNMMQATLSLDSGLSPQAPEPGAGLLAITGFVLIAAGAVRGRRRNAG
ncbi:MAG: hypothetical protein SFV51_13410 [Bryobacteraceae bacterium]|nr:hypothetical protein [Bryobacteraceae bacterium]